MLTQIFRPTGWVASGWITLLVSCMALGTTSLTYWSHKFKKWQVNSDSVFLCFACSTVANGDEAGWVAGADDSRVAIMVLFPWEGPLPSTALLRWIDIIHENQLIVNIAVNWSGLRRSKETELKFVLKKCVSVLQRFQSQNRFWLPQLKRLVR